MGEIGSIWPLQPLRGPDGPSDDIDVLHVAVISRVGIVVGHQPDLRLLVARYTIDPLGHQPGAVPEHEDAGGRVFCG
jgi:hypothetical protein